MRISMLVDKLIFHQFGNYGMQFQILNFCFSVIKDLECCAKSSPKSNDLVESSSALEWASKDKTRYESIAKAPENLSQYHELLQQSIRGRSYLSKLHICSLKLSLFQRNADCDWAIQKQFLWPVSPCSRAFHSFEFKKILSS